MLKINENAEKRIFRISGAWLVADPCVYSAAASRPLGWALPDCRTGLLGWGGWELEPEALRIASMCRTISQDFLRVSSEYAESDNTMH